MTDYEQGFADARERAAQEAAEFYTGTIRCAQTGKFIEHIRLHVEHQWSMEVARRIRALKPHS